MGRLNAIQRQGVMILVVIGLLLLFFTLIHMILALFAYKRKGKFFICFLLTIVFLGTALMCIQE